MASILIFWIATTSVRRKQCLGSCLLGMEVQASLRSLWHHSSGGGNTKVPHESCGGGIIGFPLSLCWCGCEQDHSLVSSLVFGWKRLLSEAFLSSQDAPFLQLLARRSRLLLDLVFDLLPVSFSGLLTSSFPTGDIWCKRKTQGTYHQIHLQVPSFSTS